MSTYARDKEGKFIPASQRPDGTWRKARRVKDGYVPQEEVPLYESKGKKFSTKSTLPVGMCALVVEAERKAKLDKAKKHNNKTPGVIVLPNAINNNTNDNNNFNNINNSDTNKPSTSYVHSTVPDALTSKPKPSMKINSSNIQSIDNDNCKLVNGIENLELHDNSDDDKKIKKLRKKLREIDTIEDKLKNGVLKNPEKHQLEKIARKSIIIKELNLLLN